MAKLTLARALVTLVFRFRKIEKKPHVLSSFSQGTGLGFAEDGNIGKLPGGRSWIRFLSVFLAFFFGLHSFQRGFVNYWVEILGVFASTCSELL